MNKNKLIEVLEIQSESYNQFRMFAYLIRQLNEVDCSYYVKDGNIYATKGDTELFPCVVAHMDTVHYIAEDLTAIELDGKITGFNRETMKQTGIGGDDKVGIFIALECLQKFDNIKVAFFRDEEVGCVGSYEADVSFFNNCSFVLQCDRKGNTDFVTNISNLDISSKVFQSDIKPYLKKYGYKKTYGMMTDVLALKENGISCSMANISCGYYNPHTSSEYVVINDVENCYNLVCDIITEFAGNSYPQEYKRVYYQLPPSNNTYHSDYNSNTLFDDTEYFGYKSTKLKKQECECCGEIAQTKFVSDYNIQMCYKCIQAYVYAKPLK